MPDTGTGKRYSRTRKHKEANCAPGGRRLGPSQYADGRRHNPTQHRSTPLKKRVESDAVAPCRLTPRTDPKRKFLSSSLIISPRCSQALRSRRCASLAFDSMRVLTRPVPGIVSCILCARSARQGARRHPQPPPRAVRAQCTSATPTRGPSPMHCLLRHLRHLPHLRLLLLLLTCAVGPEELPRAHRPPVACVTARRRAQSAARLSSRVRRSQ